MEKKLDITKRALKASEVNYDSYRERFNVGKANITELLSANQMLVEAQINRITAVYDYFQAQKATLFTIGQLEN